MAKISPLMVLPPVLFAALAGMFVWGMNRDNPRQLPTALAEKTAPPLVLAALGAGPALTDAALRDGRVKLVNFWASWCAPCRIEHPYLTGLAAEGVPIYGINYKDKPENAAQFLADMGNPYAAIGADASGMDTAVNWGVYGVPETFVVDGDGRILFRFAGPVTPDVIEKHLRPFLTKAK
ncbi:thiol:disulfide interchange protein [Rhodobacter veldkampii DSM 11550]|uniref:DsbE family thiol:disulfide interchange protein n=1 Tax=Phaeovulum veldkampii DSM 11550 TaxID=1185920 RepID=A0A2T4JKB5_9RHOB|nr:DsbE family thiol:disulfide interchange protein [Phaeovulum veldkampii]MBK5945452.1 thiol:disulfide interchange protein [Phaeovulum veldkampii DSM 11550]PTE18318.1 DsbE family thiol:disulfide interchange protein [Phaeovulum veldkampii DSM 11550]TDQ57797.1 cytochrome c biogenesis protein CcmG/thiol:disulfide interchange protein DsbE [Phaeovulum veldkampii DSM 11550]